MINVVINNELLNRIIEIEKNSNKVKELRVPIYIANRLRKNSKKMSSYASVKIEGNPLNQKQADKAIEDKNRHFLKPEQEVRNYYQALEELEYELKKNTKFSKELVLKIQKIVVKGESKEKIGIRGPMPPGFIFAVYDEKTGKPEYIPPEYSDVEKLLDELIDYVNYDDDHPIIKAALVHYQLVTIHPFEDGNGRTARLMSQYILDYYGYNFKNLGSLEEYYMYNQEEYYNSLQMGLPVLYYDGRNDPPHIEIWVNYFLRMLELYSIGVINSITQNSDDKIEKLLSHLNKKERAFYYYLKDNGIEMFAPIDVAKDLGVTNRTIINWSSSLCKNGLLKPNIVKDRIRKYTLVDINN